MKRTEFERVTPESVGIKSSSIEKLLDTLESGFTEMHGIMIMRHGKICAEGWWAPYAPGLRHGLQSLSKTYAATGVGLAYTEGLLKLDERVIDIFPEYSPENPSENLKKLAVHDVLCMGCGMDSMPAPTKNWIRDFLATPVAHTPGTTYMYNSVGSSLLAAIVCKKAGISLQEYLRTRLFEKIGIDADNLRWMYMPDGIEVGGGGLFSTTENNLRLMKLYADGGIWDGEQILDAEYVRKATTLQNESATEAKGNPTATDNFLGYGYQIWKCKPQDSYRADGAMGQFSIVLPHHDMIISINETAAGVHWAQPTLDAVWDFLETVTENVLPENAQESKKLTTRTNRLALPAPAFSPYSPLASELSGSTYQVTEGTLDLENAMTGAMSGATPSEGIEMFCMHFYPDYCLFDFVRDGSAFHSRIAIDGSRAHNILQFSNSPTSQCYLSGAWAEADTFVVTCRWIETCFEKVLAFHFKNDTVHIEVKNNVGRFASMAAVNDINITARKK